MLADDRAHRDADFVLSAQRIALAVHSRLDKGEVFLRGIQQFAAFPRTFGGQFTVAADHQPFARKVRRADFGHIARVEQRHLQRAVICRQSLDRRCTQGGDPVQPGRLKLLAETCLGDHAPVADQHHAVELEAPLQFLDLRGKRLGIACVSREHLDRHGAAIGGAEKPVDDLQLALFAIAVVAEASQVAAAAFDIARRDVVKHQAAALEMFAGQPFFHFRLAGEQPVERFVKLRSRDRSEPQNLPRAGASRWLIQHSRCGQLGSRGYDPVYDHGQDKIAGPVAFGAEDPVEAGVADRAHDGGNVAMGQRACNGEGILAGRQRRSAFEDDAQAFHLLRGPGGKVEKGALFDLAAIAIALAQKHGRRRVPIGDGPIYMVDNYAALQSSVNTKPHFYMGTSRGCYCCHSPQFQCVGR